MNLRYDAETETLRSGRKSHGAGEAITVVVSGADEALGRLELEPARKR